jgi:hypothetical protein
VQAALDQADAALRRAQGALGQAEGVVLFGGLQQLLARVHVVAAEVRAARPVAACPFCKRLPHFKSGCQGCKGTEFVGADVMLGVADELKLGGDKAMVATPAGPVPYGKAASAPVKAAPKAKKIRIENERGEELVPAGDETTDGLPF